MRSRGRDTERGLQSALGPRTSVRTHRLSFLGAIFLLGCGHRAVRGEVLTEARSHREDGPLSVPSCLRESPSKGHWGKFVYGAVALFLLGCGHRTAERPGGAILAASPTELAPNALPGEKATLRLGESTKALPAAEFEVGISKSADGSDAILKLSVGGETIERETYESRPEAFRAVAVGEQAFAPPLDLLRYPVRDGAAWGWRGKVVYAGVSRDGSAGVAVSKDGGDVRSDVRLSIATDPGRPDLVRSLSFGFRKGHGVVRRAFGGVSSRWPVGEAWRP